MPLGTSRETQTNTVSLGIGGLRIEEPVPLHAQLSHLCSQGAWLRLCLCARSSRATVLDADEDPVAAAAWLRIRSVLPPECSGRGAAGARRGRRCCPRPTAWIRRRDIPAGRDTV